MSDQVITAAVEAAAIVPEIWSARFFEVLLASLPFNASISRDYEGDISDLGDIANIYIEQRRKIIDKPVRVMTGLGTTAMADRACSNNYNYP